MSKLYFIRQPDELRRILQSRLRAAEASQTSSTNSAQLGSMLDALEEHPLRRNLDEEAERRVWQRIIDGLVITSARNRGTRQETAEERAEARAVARVAVQIMKCARESLRGDGRAA